MIKGFIFDLDGVLTDTAAYHFEAWKQLADELGLRFTIRDNARLKGISRLASFEVMLEVNNAQDRYTPEEKAALADRKNGYYQQLVEKITPADILPGVADFLGAAKAAGLKLAVASASKNAFRVLELLGLKETFDYVADARYVVNPKPHPEVFLNCVEALGLQPEECVGFEDALAGIQAIHAGGMFAVGIGVGCEGGDVYSSPDAIPDLPLPGTAALNLQTVLEAAQK